VRYDPNADLQLTIQAISTRHFGNASTNAGALLCKIPLSKRLVTRRSAPYCDRKFHRQY
jgi:hypothetical protein